MKDSVVCLKAGHRWSTLGNLRRGKHRKPGAGGETDDEAGGEGGGDVTDQCFY